jgi:hypothetical protein
VKTARLTLARLRRPSLVRRLIWLAAVWSLLVLLVAGVALTAFFQRSALNRFDLGLFDLTEGLYAGATVEEGQMIAPCGSIQGAIGRSPSRAAPRVCSPWCDPAPCGTPN